ncbi:unnamed protein product [Caenorhabditis auriculariae]|uniref:Uncharacterized protein n=1 Tax=Caenorhabditis auriculariae TaxID=2777116 RepID=A0A8S1HRF4_9PELO|nr:unnamed protein product [Caenorhabditis auriculariae]
MDGDVENLGLEQPLLTDRSASFLNKLNVPRNSVCNANTVQSVSSFRSEHVSRKSTAKLLENPNQFARALSEKLSAPWIENTFEKRECVKFIAQAGDPERCGCGRKMTTHSTLAQSRFYVFTRLPKDETWTIANNTKTSPTDAFGTIVFQGGAHAHKAQYVRLAYDSDPLDVMYLMEKVWGLETPRLVITVHGGTSNFDLQDRLGKIFRSGMLKAAQTTGAWIITSGLDSGVVRHVAKALDEAGISARMRSQIVTIGIAPWGIIKRKERLIGKNEDVPYDVHSLKATVNMGILNDRHSYFLLADNGTTGRFGADLHLRQNFENYIATYGSNGRKIPVVCTVLEGGINTINAVHNYVTMKPDIPAIVCDGSGRAADVLSFAARYINRDGTFAAEVEEKLTNLIRMVFPGQDEVRLADLIGQCSARSDLLRIFRYVEEEEEDVDYVILSTVLEKQNLPPDEQLALTLSWNRVDLAKSCLFSRGRKWASDILNHAMAEALHLNRVDFVECLLENGVSMKSFLTINTLENLYNRDDGTEHSVRFLIDELPLHTYLTLPLIGTVIEKLMGNAFMHYYTSRLFRTKYEQFKKNSQAYFPHRKSKSKEQMKKRTESMLDDAMSQESEETYEFVHPFNDLLVWAVLTRRSEMARCMWVHGEDAMPKCLVAIRLYKAAAKIAEQEYLEVEIANRLRQHAVKFREDAIDLIDQCYRSDHEKTLRLLRTQLPHWGHHNCLSLAVLANTKAFLATPCCQMLLAELWHGSLRVRSGSNLRVLTAMIFPPAIINMAFKPKPQRMVQENEDQPGKIGDNLRHSSIASTSRMFDRRTSKQLLTQCEEGNEFLAGNGNGGKKVTILSSRQASACGSVYGSASSIGLRKEAVLTKVERLRAFYSAPITKFWAWCIAFHTFLILSTYTLLIEFPLKPTYLEWLTLAYSVTLIVEHLFSQETSKFREKLSIFYSKYYNLLTLFALIFFIVGFGMRLHPPFRHSWGRVLLSCSNVLWFMKMFEYLSVHPLLGPYIQMAAKMVASMCYIIVLLLVTLMAFGVSRQAITYPKSKWSWMLVRNIFYKPYFMLYGEVYAGEIDTCGDDGANCVPGNFLPPILMTIFLLVANILLLNLLIAIFNNIFNEANERSKEVWLFQRYGQLIEYHDSTFLPPPFNVVAHFFHFLMFLCGLIIRKNLSNNHNSQYSLKLVLSAEELKKMQDFEEDCVDMLTRRRLRTNVDVTEPSNVSKITEITCQKVNDLMQENFLLKGRMYDLETKLDFMSRTNDEILGILRTRKTSRRESVSMFSLPDSCEVKIRREPTCEGMLGVLAAAEDRVVTRSPLLTNLQRDHTLRKYDDANLQVTSLQRRPRHNSSSFSISQDMRDMQSTKSPTVDSSQTSLTVNDDGSSESSAPE